MAEDQGSDANSSIVLSQPRIFDFIMSGRSKDGYATRSKTQPSSDPPERQSKKKSNKIRKSEEKTKRQRKNRQEKMNTSRHHSGDSIHSISSQSSQNTSDNELPSAPSPAASRTVSQMLESAYDSPPSTPSSQSDQNLSDTSEEIAKFKVYIEYLESENKSIKLQRDLLHTDLENAQKIVGSLKKSNKTLTNQIDTLHRAASRRSGTRRHTDLHTATTQTTPPLVTNPNSAAALQEATDVAIAKYNSICDQMSKAAQQLLDTVSNAKVSVSPSHTSNSNSNATPSEQDFQTVTHRNNRRRPAERPAPDIQQIPVISSDVPGIHQAQVHAAPAVPSYSEVTRQRRPGQGARQRKKLIILGTSLTDGLSAELRSHNIDSTTHIYRGGKLELIRERVPYIFSKDINKQPNEVLLLAGGNDAEETTTDRTINEYEGLIRDLRTACPRTKIIVSSIPPRKNDSSINHRIKEVNEYLRDRGLRGDNVKFVDVIPVESNMFTKKQVHLNDNGKQEFARRLQPFLSN